VFYSSMHFSLLQYKIANELEAVETLGVLLFASRPSGLLNPWCQTGCSKGAQLLKTLVFSPLLPFERNLKEENEAF